MSGSPPAGNGDVRLLLETETGGFWTLEQSQDGDNWYFLTTIPVESGVGVMSMKANEVTRFFRAVEPVQ